MKIQSFVVLKRNDMKNVILMLYIKRYERDASAILGNSICMYASCKIGVAS